MNRLQYELFTPFLEVHKIDICGEVLATRAQVNPHALYPLMTKVSAQCSTRLSMVDFGWRTAVVDCQKCATLKLVIERSPDGAGALFRADTHDRHVQPKPDSPEAVVFAELLRKNQELAQQIEELEEVLGKLDGQLSLKNATLLIDV